MTSSSKKTYKIGPINYLKMNFKERTFKIGPVHHFLIQVRIVRIQVRIVRRLRKLLQSQCQVLLNGRLDQFLHYQNQIAPPPPTRLKKAVLISQPSMTIY